MQCAFLHSTSNTEARSLTRVQAYRVAQINKARSLPQFMQISIEGGPDSELWGHLRALWGSHLSQKQVTAGKMRVRLRMRAMAQAFRSPSCRVGQGTGST